MSSQSKPKSFKSSNSGDKKKRLKSTGKSLNKKNNKREQNNQQQDNKNVLLQKQRLLNLNTDKQLQLIKQIHNKIVINPEEQIKHLQSLFTLVKTPNLRVVATVLRVLAQIFISVAPLQAVDIEKIKERTENRIKKQEYKVVKFQRVLVEQYERYIKMLKQLNLKTKPDNFKNDKEMYTQFKKCILQCVVKLYRTLWNFNFAKQLNDLCLKFIKYEECREFLKEMLMDENIAIIGIKSKIIGGIAKIIKTEQIQKRLPSDILKILNCTFVNPQYLKKDQQSLNYKKKQLKKKLYRQQALQSKKQKQKRAEKGTLEYKKQMKQQKAKQKMRVKDEVDKQFQEGEATLKNRQVVRHNSQILQELFYIYFKILVEKINSIFLRDALDGILKFVHLINIELTKSLIEHLDVSAVVFRDFWRTKKTVSFMEVRLLIIFTGQSIINGPLSVFNMDDTKITTHLFKILRDLNQKQTKISKEVYRLLCITLEEAFIKRRQLSQELIGSIARQVSIFLKEKETPKIFLLQFLRLLAYRYPKISRMFETDNEGFGLNSFNPMVEDPQCSNAINTQIVSFLRSIKSHVKSKEYQNQIDRIVQKLCKQNFLAKDTRESLYSILDRQMSQSHF